MFLPVTEAALFDWHGLAISDHTAALELSASVATIDVPAGARHPARVRFEVGGESSDLGPADVCIVRRGEVFQYANRTPHTVRLALVHTPPFDADAEHLEE